MHSPDAWVPSGYISLRDEIGRRGRERFKFGWPVGAISEGLAASHLKTLFNGRSLDEKEASLYGFNKEPRERVIDIIEELFCELYDGKKQAFRRTEIGFEPIAKDWWMSHSATRVLSDWSKLGGDIFLKIEETRQPINSIASAEVRCEKWLIAERKEWPDHPPKSREEYWASGRKEFAGLSEAGFKRAWKAAAEKQPASGWNKSGRRKTQNRGA